MSYLSRVPLGVSEAVPVPLVPEQYPLFHEAVPAGTRRYPPMGVPVPVPPPKGGTGVPPGTAGLPEWLRRLLVSQGTLSENGLGRVARLRSCRSCRLLTVAGLDADVAAGEAHCDPAPLSPIGEVLALRDGRRTYALWTAGRRQELEPRTRYTIRGYPAGTPRRPPVLAGHVCGQPIPGAWCAPLEPAPEPIRGDEW